MARFNQVINVTGGVTPTMVLRDDGAFVLTDPKASDADAAELKAWLAAGNTLGAPVKPPAPDPLTSWDTVTLQIAFNHENRIRALESKAPVTLAQFKTAVRSLLP